MRVIMYATLRAAVGSRIVDFGPEVGPGSTVWDAVHALISRYPVLEPELLDGDGQLWRHVHVMVNGRDVPYLERGLHTPLSADDTLDVFPPGMRAITALLVLRNQVIKPIVAGVQSSVRPTKPTISTTIDQHYERLRLDLQPLFQELGIAA